MRAGPIYAIAIAGVLAACSGGTMLPPAQSGRLTGGVGGLTPKSEAAKATFNPFEDNTGRGHTVRDVISNPTFAQVMKVGALPEISLGREDAPVTIIKYASLTCPYCRKFHLETFPQLKREYIDTGKVRFILREFPIGFQSGAATIALRCAPRESYFKLYGNFLRNQRAWVSQEVRRDPIFRIVRQTGLTRRAFDACYDDAALVENLKWVKERGRKLGVIGTPNFFVNNRLFKRVLTMTDFHNLVAEELAKPVASTL